MVSHLGFWNACIRFDASHLPPLDTPPFGVPQGPQAQGFHTGVHCPTHPPPPKGQCLEPTGLVSVPSQGG